MEELAVMCGGEMEELKELEERDCGGAAAAAAAGGGGGGVVKWEKFMPRMTMRVLLVEADDSTRQVVGALLRKCGYRVTAVPDGLKAWEILKGKPYNVDLVLTEVELPSISGFALLSLVSEHDVCKNIPVIMMSKQDSMNLVYKCMLRGAADYLVKPIRRNELQNLWQHVWRRQTSTVDGNGIQDESVAQQKVEVMAENTGETIESSGPIASAQRENEFIEKGSDAQSSCTTPVLEAETEHLNKLQEFPQPAEQTPNTSDTRIKVPENCLTPSWELLLMQGVHAGTRKEDEPEVEKRNPNVAAEDFSNNNVELNSYKVAIDLIGAFDNYQHGNVTYTPSRHGSRKVDLSLKLDLSLKRSDPCGFVSETTTLKHSDVSAFSRYVGKPSQPCPVTAGSTSLALQQKEYGSTEKDTPYLVNGYHSGTPSPALSTPKSILSLATSQTKQSGYALPCPQQGVFPASVPPGRTKTGDSNNDFGSIIRRAYCVQSGQSPMPSPSNACQQESFRGDSSDQSICQTNNMEHQYRPLEQNAMSSPNQFMQRQQLRFDSLDHQEQFSSATDKSGSSSLRDGTLTRLNSMDCGSICENSGNVNHLTMSKMEKESNVEGYYITRDGNSQRSIQREAALTKFRLKRKDRNFEKKVRYESRKKLAEQRPRVKGQFVRQVHVDPAPQVNH